MSETTGQEAEAKPSVASSSWARRVATALVGLAVITLIVVKGPDAWVGIAYEDIEATDHVAEPVPGAPNQILFRITRSRPAKRKVWSWLPGPTYILEDSVCEPCEKGQHGGCRAQFMIGPPREDYSGYDLAIDPFTCECDHGP